MTKNDANIPPRLGRFVAAALHAALAFFVSGCSDGDRTGLEATTRSALEAGERPVALPAPPRVAPAPIRADDIDRDGNKLDDAIDRALAAAHTGSAAPATLHERIEVTLFFSAPLEDGQLRAFASAGGAVRRVYRQLAYGFQGSLPRAAVPALARALGSSLVVVEEAREIVRHLDEATSRGRVRPIWSDFAGNAAGFRGSSSTTIAVVDTGVDDTHRDLAGRVVYWRDLTTDAAADPVDVSGHGTHVAGVALGSGEAFGVGPGTLLYTDNGIGNALHPGVCWVSSVHLPAGAGPFALDAAFTGSSSASLFLVSFADGSLSEPRSMGSSSGSSPLSVVASGPFSANSHYTACLPAPYSTATIRNSVSNVSAFGDGFPRFRGVASGSGWAGFKVFTAAGHGTSLTLMAALDEIADVAPEHDIKVANLSVGIGSNASSWTLRSFANALVHAGVVTCVSAGNDGPAGIVGDPGRAGLVLTVGSTNDMNQLTSYTSRGFDSPASGEGTKPDVLAPGGSALRSMILAPDTNDADVSASGDTRLDDYANMQGTSMAAPFAAGAAALVIEGLESTGVEWTWPGSAQPLLVKMLLSASATETNAAREAGGYDPELGRAAAPKDLDEGYGIINPDAAIEAVRLAFGTGLVGSSAGGFADRRAWGRHLAVTAGQELAWTLDIDDGGGDYDVYLYSGTPAPNGEPALVAFAASEGAGVNESLAYTAPSDETLYLFVKRIAGGGAFTLRPAAVCGNADVEGGEECDDGNTLDGDCCSASCRFAAAGAECGPPPGADCEAQDVCDGAGTCVAVLAPAGTSCSDDDACNGEETCDASGSCLAGVPIVCVASDACHLPGTCRSLDGSCSNPIASDGTRCPGGVCSTGACVPDGPSGGAGGGGSSAGGVAGRDAAGGGGSSTDGSAGSVAAGSAAGSANGRVDVPGGSAGGTTGATAAGGARAGGGTAGAGSRVNAAEAGVGGEDLAAAADPIDVRASRGCSCSVTGQRSPRSVPALAASIVVALVLRRNRRFRMNF